MQNRQFIAAGLGSALAMIAFAGLKVSATPVIVRSCHVGIFRERVGLTEQQPRAERRPVASRPGAG